MLRSAFRLCAPALLLLAGNAAAREPRTMTLEQALASHDADSPALDRASGRGF